MKKVLAITILSLIGISIVTKISIDHGFVAAIAIVGGAIAITALISWSVKQLIK